MLNLKKLKTNNKIILKINFLKRGYMLMMFNKGVQTTVRTHQSLKE